MSAHHPRAPLRVVGAPEPMVPAAELECLARYNAYYREYERREAEHARAMAEISAWPRELRLFHRFCLRGWLSMLVVQIRGEA